MIKLPFDQPHPNLLEELKKLREKINYHNYLYNTLDQPEISDYEYDQTIQSSEGNLTQPPRTDNPRLANPKKVGPRPSERFQKVNHPTQVLSLTNAFGFAGKQWTGTTVYSVLEPELEKC